MTEEQGYSRNQLELLKKLKNVGSDLWGVLGDAGAAVSSDDGALPAPAAKKAPNPMDAIWKTADETIDWTDALAHNTPTDGLTGQRLWNFYHKQAERVLSGDLDAYTEVLKAANPLGELTDYAESITMRAPSADRLESCFICRAELMEKDRKLYLAAMGLRIARDLLACLPAEEVAVTAEENGKTAFKAVYTRQQLLHRNFNFVDPVALSEEFGAEYN